MEEPKNKNNNTHSSDDDPYLDVGRRIYAAVVSANLGLKSIDHAFKHFTPERLHPSWGQLGFKLQRNLVDSVGRQLRAAVAKHEASKIHLVEPTDPDQSRT